MNPPARRHLQVTESLGAGDPVNLEMAGGLEPPHCGLGARSITPVDGTRRLARSGQLPLQPAHPEGSATDISIARAKDQLGRGERREGERAGDSVDSQTVSGLEADYCFLRQRSVAPVDWTRGVPQAGQPTLKRP